MKRPRFRIFIILALLVSFFAGVQLNAGQSPSALLGVFNYSGTSKAGGIDLAERVAELCSDLINKQTHLVVSDYFGDGQTDCWSRLAEFSQVH